MPQALFKGEVRVVNKILLKNDYVLLELITEYLSFTFNINYKEFMMNSYDDSITFKRKCNILTAVIFKLRGRKWMDCYFVILLKNATTLTRLCARNRTIKYLHWFTCAKETFSFLFYYIFFC